MSAAATWAPAMEVSDATRRHILAAVLLGIFLSVLDQTIIATALPVVIGRIGGADHFTWVTTIYLLTSTIAIPFYGKLSDQYGRKPLMLAGMAIFAVGSVLSGFATSIDQLIAFRGIQGIGAGALHPIALAVIGDLYAPADRAKPQSLFGAIFALAAIVGPTLGGFLAENVGWPAIFFVNVPVAVVAMAIAARSMPPGTRSVGEGRFDIVGATTFAAAISFILVGLTNVGAGDWFDPTAGGFIAIGIALVAAFARIEVRATDPILPPRLFRSRTIALSIVASFFGATGFYGAVILLPLWFQTVQGATPTSAGFQILALLMGIVVGAMAGGGIVARTGRYRVLLLASTAVAAVGFAVLSRIGPDMPSTVLWAAMFVAGIGLGPTFSIFTVVVQNAVPMAQMGIASASLTFFRQIGGAVGLAILGTVFAAVARSAAADGADAAGATSAAVGAAFVIAVATTIIAAIAIAGLHEVPFRTRASARVPGAVPAGAE